ncbi:MAG: class I SAM-dependent methyltransferase [Pseudonocardiales bacterium]|nr:class I SAM-dependent methyltransferase [Pseudonocardiales bacterium]
MGNVRGWLYDRAITGLTTGWYRAVLERLPDGARVLDVGMGTGGALARNADLVRAKGLHVTGLDIDADYHRRSVEEMARAGLTGSVTPRLESVYDHQGGPYDAAYFSASLMLLPDAVAALRHVIGLLDTGGRLFFTQTFHHRRSVLRERVKPLLRHLTTIHFGRMTYEAEFRAVLAEAGLSLVEFVTLERTRSASYRLAVATPGDSRSAAA